MFKIQEERGLTTHQFSWSVEGGAAAIALGKIKEASQSTREPRERELRNKSRQIAGLIVNRRSIPRNIPIKKM